MSSEDEIKPGMRVTINGKKALTARMHRDSIKSRDAGTMLGWYSKKLGLVKVKWDRLKHIDRIWIGFLLPLKKEEERHRGE